MKPESMLACAFLKGHNATVGACIVNEALNQPVCSYPQNQFALTAFYELIFLS
ncbi:MAG: hypothetical protein P8O91_01255 [Luminiphilus sp.]|nr:hypothetical protein [Luminiphilus sp.]